MDVEAVVRESLKVMGDAGVPEPLQPTALPEIIKLVASQAPGAPLTALIPYQQQPPNQPALLGAGGGGDLLARLAARLGVPGEVVEGVYTSDGNSVEISVHPARLPKTRSTATKNLALLVTAMRQATSDEEFTSVDEIRRIAQDYDRLDAANFASAIGEMRGAFLVKGSARQRSLKLTRPGWQQAADLVKQLGGQESD
jgi:hypothetical protein